MQQVSRHLLILLGVVALGIVVQSNLHPQQKRVPNPGFLGNFPYQLGPFSGRDIKTAEATETRTSYHPAEIVFREYLDADRSGIELFIAPVPFGSKDPAGCLRYHGWILNHAEETYLGTTPPTKVREIVALSPPGQLDQAYACVYYWRGKRAGYENQLRVALRQKINRLLGREEDALAIQVCRELRHESEATLAFEKLCAFASNVDPIIAAMLRDSKILAGQR